MKLANRFLSLILVMLVIFTSVDMTVFAVENEEIIDEEEVVEEEEPEEDIEGDEIITSFAEFETVTTHYKLALDSIKEKLPETIQANTNRNQLVSLRIYDWSPVDNYDENIGTYRFTPFFDSDYALSEGVEVPTLTVHVEDESDGATGFLEPTYEEEVPSAKSLIDTSMLRRAASSSDSKYNAYESNLLPVVREQDTEGACWAFATMGAIEADLIKNGKASAPNVDASELQLAYFTAHNYTDPKGCRPNDSITYSGTDSYLNNGGHDSMAGMALMNKIGPIEEKYAPYSKGHTYVLNESLAMGKNFARVNNIYDININDRDLIKQAILQHGAVTAAIHSSAGYYSATYNSYYGTTDARNHEVILVGWDDKFPSYNFGGYDKPMMNGAWLVRNSWGLDDYGKNGYFWISYEDASLLGGGSVKAYSVDTNVFDNVYSYAAGEQTTTLAGTGNTITFSVEYQVDAGEAIKAVAVQTLNANARIDVTVTADGQSAAGTSSNKTAGTYTIPLSGAITTSDPTTATVTVKITAAAGDRAKIVLEPFNAEGVTPTIGTQRNVVMGGITHTVTLDKGFKVGSSQRYDGDPKIRLYTDNTDAAPANPSGHLEITNGLIYDYANSTHQLEFSADSVVLDPSMVSWSVIDEDVATVSADGVVTVGSKRGTTVITGTYTDGSVSYKASINVTVRPYAISYNLAADEKCRRQYLEYYPGDAANCKLPVAADMSKDGYELNGWKDASGATVTVDTLKTGSGDLVLTPKWNRYEIAVRYYKPNEDGESYTTTKKFIDSFMITAAPFVLPSPESMDDSPLNYVADGKQFSYWSKDAGGKEMVTSIGAEAFKAKQNPYLGTYSIDKDIVLYPQFDKPVPKPAQPVTGGGESNVDGGHGNYVAPAVVDVHEASVPVQNRIVTAKTTANLRMRAGAGTGYRIITTVRRGDLVQILGTAVNGWYPCKYGEFVGFMSARYIADLMIVDAKPLDDAKPEEKEDEYYVVKKGDTLGKIARKYWTSVGEMVRMNKEVHPRITEDYIVTGWKIRVR